MVELAIKIGEYLLVFWISLLDQWNQLRARQLTSTKRKRWIYHLLDAVSSAFTMLELLFALKNMHRIYYSIKLVEPQPDA